MTNSAVYAFVFLQQLILVLAEVRMLEDAIDRAYQSALRFIFGTNALSAKQRVYNIRAASNNCFVGADRTARIAGGAVLANQQRHGCLLVMLSHGLCLALARLQHRPSPRHVVNRKQSSNTPDVEESTADVLSNFELGYPSAVNFAVVAQVANVKEDYRDYSATEAIK